MKTISSRKNPRVKNAVRLRDRRQRNKQGCFLVEGTRELDRAIHAGIELLEVFVCLEKCTGEESQRLLNYLTEHSVSTYEVPEPVFSKMAFGSRVEGFLAVAKTPHSTLAERTLPEMPLVAVLEGVEKPGNVGAVLRSADAAGLHGLIVADSGTDLYNPSAIRTSLGTIFSQPVHAATAEETLHWLRQQGLAIFAARVDGSILYTEANFCQPAAIVLGSEAEGLTSLWSADDITAVCIPMRGVADSLNVSVSAAILFHEAMRQRKL